MLPKYQQSTVYISFLSRLPSVLEFSVSNDAYTDDFVGIPQELCPLSEHSTYQFPSTCVLPFLQIYRDLSHYVALCWLRMVDHGPCRTGYLLPTFRTWWYGWKKRWYRLRPTTRGIEMTLRLPILSLGAVSRILKTTSGKDQANDTWDATEAC